MTDSQETTLYVILNLQNQGQAVTVDALRQPLKLLGFYELEIEVEVGRLVDLGLMVGLKANEFFLTELGLSEASRIHKIKVREEFNGVIDRASRSGAYLDLCSELYGYRMPLFNMMDKEQLDFAFGSIPLSGSDTVLDLGCGTGCILNHLVNKYGCKGIGIDQIDPQEDAKNDTISYIKGDIDDFLEYKITPTVSLSMDSLYFSADLQALINNLKSVSESRMYLFYSQYIFDSNKTDRTTLHADHTRLASVLNQAGIAYKTVDFSTNERLLYENGLTILPKYRQSFESEGNTSLYENKLKEYSMGKDLYDQGLASRYLYTVMPEGI